MASFKFADDDDFDPLEGQPKEETSGDGDYLEGQYRPQPFDDDDDGFEDLYAVGEDGAKEALPPGDPDRAKGAADVDKDDGEEVDDEETLEAEADEDEDDEKADLRRRIEEQDNRARALEERLNALQAAEDQRAESQYEQAKREHEERIEQAKAKLRKAVAEGNVDDQLEATDEMTTLKASPPTKPEPRQSTPATPATPAGSSLPPKAQAFLDDNPWIDSPRHGQLLEGLQKIDKELIAEQYSPNQDRYYKELVSRLKQQFPRQQHLIRNPHAKRSGKRSVQRESPAHGAADRAAPTSRKKGNSKVLTAEDVRQMRIYRLNPRDPKVREEWLANRKVVENA